MRSWICCGGTQRKVKSIDPDPSPSVRVEENVVRQRKEQAGWQAGAALDCKWQAGPGRSFSAQPTSGKAHPPTHPPIRSFIHSFNQSSIHSSHISPHSSPESTPIYLPAAHLVPQSPQPFHPFIHHHLSSLPRYCTVLYVHRSPAFYECIPSPHPRVHTLIHSFAPSPH